MKRSLLFILIFLSSLLFAGNLLVSDALADEDCEYKADREAMIDMDGEMAGIESIEITSKAGLLEVIGASGLNRVEITGEACASDAALLEKTIVRTRRAGKTLVIESEVAEGSWGWRSSSARLDLRIKIPAGLPVEIEDGSGGVEVRGTGRLTIEDGSGSLRIENIEGDVQIEDGSGDIDLQGVRGNVEIDDGSGSIRLADITGSVEVEDGSGEIEIERVGANVRVRDGSGSIDVREIAGDFTVADDGSGSIRHRDVAGRIDIPTDD